MTGDEIPKARVRRRRLFRLIWMVPVMAVAVAAYLVFHRMQDFGPEVIVAFSDGGGLRVGQTPVRYRGVQVGEVTNVRLSKDEKKALVRIRLIRSAEGIAREGSRFWIVRPHVGFGQVTGLGTVLSGPEIDVLPGKEDAKPEFEFTGSRPIRFPPTSTWSSIRASLRWCARARPSGT